MNPIDLRIWDIAFVDGHLSVITGGQYRGTHGISNFWTWRRVNKNGVLSKKEHSGYFNGSHTLKKAVGYKKVITILPYTLAESGKGGRE